MNDWRLQASCRGLATADYDPWFPTTGAEEKHAEKICRDCPVKVECGQFAFNNGEEFGIFGGLTERERRKQRRQTTRPTIGLRKCPQCRHGFVVASNSQQRYCSAPCRKRHAADTGANAKGVKPARRNPQWSPQEDRTLIRMLLNQHTYTDIGNELERSRKAVESRALLLRRAGRFEVNYA